MEAGPNTIRLCYSIIQMMRIKGNSDHEIENGTLASNAKIGGLIEIHGNGGKGIDWTEGCIALTDKEIDACL